MVISNERENGSVIFLVAGFISYLPVFYWLGSFCVWVDSRLKPFNRAQDEYAGMTIQQNWI
jgi:hypothetical protein